MTYHDTKLDDGLMKIQVYSDRMSYFKIVTADACRVVALGAKTGEEAHSEGRMKKEECRNETKRTKSVAAFSSFIIPSSAFEMSLVTRRCRAMAWQASAATGAELGQCHAVEAPSGDAG
jgi:hypothetical protein